LQIKSDNGKIRPKRSADDVASQPQSDKDPLEIVYVTDVTEKAPVPSNENGIGKQTNKQAYKHNLRL